MNLYIDTEFSNFNGQLISMAVVSSMGHEFYEVRNYKEFAEYINPWVWENVIPSLLKEPISDEQFNHKFWSWFINLEIKPTDIYADWPEDLAYFLREMCRPEGKRIGGEYRFHLIHSGDVNSLIPHNALEDARALKKWHLGEQ
jgi:hypothetical protein